MRKVYKLLCSQESNLTNKEAKTVIKPLKNKGFAYLPSNDIKPFS